MRSIERKISSLVRSQFPAFYQEEGPQFIAFVQAYFEWLETQGPVYHARRLTEYKDIDTTLDQFILYFKEKYLKNIQFDVATNKKLLVKNSLDLHRSKGTERSIDLFFNLVYGTNSRVRYPKENIFRLSDGVWEKPIYLEITPSDRSVDLVGKKVVGTQSGASAFVERFIRRMTGAGYVNVLFLSNLIGDFSKGEILASEVDGVVTSHPDSPRLIGSLRQITIQDGSRDFKVGDLVRIVSDHQGVGGLARVTATSDATGAVDFIFLDGGWGYTNSSSYAIVSEKVLSLSNVATRADSTSYHTLFEKIIEPLVTISVDNIVGGSLAVGDSIFRYDDNGVSVAQATIVNTDISSTTGNGTIQICDIQGPIVGGSNTYYTLANSVNFEAIDVSNRTVEGTIMGIPESYSVEATVKTGSIAAGDILYQKDALDTFASATVTSVSTTSAGSIVINIDAASGAFKNAYSTYNISDTSYKFNANTGIDNATYFISIDNNTFVTDDLVRYRTATANTAVSGLSNNEVYYVIGANTSGFKVSSIRGGEAIPLIAALSINSNGHFFDAFNKNVKTARIASNTTSIVSADNFIKIPSNPFVDGDVVYYTTAAGNTAITGMANNRSYYVIASNTSGIKLSDTYNGSAVAITSSLDETGHDIIGKSPLRAKTEAGADIPTFTADLVTTSMNVGVYNIRKSTYDILYTEATSNSLFNDANSIFNSQYVYTYTDDGVETGKGLVISATQQANDGIVSIQPISGYFSEGKKFYAEANAASASISSYSQSIKGGDFLVSEYSNILGLFNGTEASITRASTGSGAGFEVGSVGDVESIYIATDQLSSNSVEYINTSRRSLTVGAGHGFAVGDVVYQQLYANVTSNSTGINATSGFIKTIASNMFANGDLIEYRTTDTPIERNVIPFGDVGSAYGVALANGDQFFVASANTTGFKLTETREGNTFVLLKAQATGTNNHIFAKISAAGTVVETNSTDIVVSDVYKQFVNTAGVGLYTNAISYDSPATNAAITDVASDIPYLAPAVQYPVERIRASAYGFPKNPQGSIVSSINTCLTFGKFDIGTIGNIFGLDPGSNYDTDPYVLVYQPYIAPFNRKDYTFHIENVSGAFVGGERISQTPISLTFYDLRMSRGAEDAQYSEVTKNINPLLDVDSASDFIYVPYREVTIDANTAVDHIVVRFNATYDIDPTIDFISVASNPFVDGDEITYIVSGTAAPGLANNTTYYVLAANSSGFQLAANSTTTAPIDIARTIASGTHKLLKDANNFISVASNVFTNNMIVRYYTDDLYTAIGGLANSNLYAVVNTTPYGFMLANTSNTLNIISVTPTANLDSAHNFRSYLNGNTFSNEDQFVYYEYNGGTSFGLTNATAYYVVSANGLGFKASTLLEGSPVDLDTSSITTSETGHYYSTLPGYLPGDTVYQEVLRQFNGFNAVSETTDFIALTDNQFANGDSILYYTGSGMTPIISNNQFYVVAAANSSGIKLANSSGSIQELARPASSEANHFVKTIPTGYVSRIYTSGGDGYVRLSNVTQTFATGYALKSNTYSFINEGTVDAVNTFATFATAQGIIKQVTNTSSMTVKRTEFENTWIPGETITGSLSGATATVSIVEEDSSSMAIGTNAVVEANVITANGTVAALQVIDSGLNYSNSEIVQYYSDDNQRSGTAKIEIDNHGISRGYYRSSKGFLSADMKVHDGDYYQEYSYEVLSRVSFDRYQDMFKKVIHVSGTKVFGSVLLEEVVSKQAEIANIGTEQIIEFNPRRQIDTAQDSIDVGKLGIMRSFLPLRIDSENNIYIRDNPFSVGDIVKYVTVDGATADFGLSNNDNYYVVYSGDNLISLSTTDGGDPVNIDPQTSVQWGHTLTAYSNIFANGDIVEYYPEYRSFNKNTDIDDANNFIYLANNTFDVHDMLVYKKTATGVANVNGLIPNSEYVVIEANATGVILGAGSRKMSTVFKYDPTTKDATIFVVPSEVYANADIYTQTYTGISTIEYEINGGTFELNAAGYKITANNYQADMFVDGATTPEVLFRYNEDAAAVGNVNVVLVGSDFFRKTTNPNWATYSYSGDKVSITVPETFLIDHYVADDNEALDGILPTENSGGEVDLLVPIADIGQSDIDFSQNFITTKNTNDTTGQRLFSNGDLVSYTAALKNIPITGLFETVNYYVVGSNTTGFKISTTLNGTAFDFVKESASIDSVRDVADESDFLVIRNNVFSAGDPLIYTSNTGYRPINGLSNNTTYYVKYANNIGVRLATSPRGATINVAPANTFTYSFNGDTGVANTTDFIAVTSNPYVNGDIVIYSANTKVTPIAGLANNSAYIVLGANSTGVKLSSDGSSAINITSTKTNLVTFTAPSAVQSGSDFIQMTHSFSTNDRVLYYTAVGSDVITGLSNNATYYVAAANSTGIKLSSTSGGGAIDITAPGGTGSSYIEMYIDGKHHLASANTVGKANFERQLSPSGYKFAVINNDNGSGHILYKRTPTNDFELGQRFFVVDADKRTIKLSETLFGNAVSLVADKDENGHYIKKIVEE